MSPDRAINEAELLNRAQVFDQEALADIYRAYQQPLYRYVYHHLGHVQTAQDLTAEIFGRFLQALRRGRGPTDHLKAWLYRVGHNLVVDELRRRSYRQHQQLDDVLAESLCDEKQNPDEQVWVAITSAEVRQALTELAPDQRQVVILKFLEGWDNAEISQVTGKTVGAVKALQHRALRSIRKKMAIYDQRVPVRQQHTALGHC